MRKRILIAGGCMLALLAGLGGVIVVRALTVPTRQIEVQPVEVDIDHDAAVERLAEALRFVTISEPDAIDPEPFLALHDFLEASFPRVHETLEREVVNDLTLHMVWRGTDPQARHVVMLAHQDVVPVEQQTREDWTHPPFDGVVADGFVWGRGTLDHKSGLMGLLEAVEAMLAEGVRPRRTIHFVFGHDEEVGGEEGAREVARRFEAREVQVKAIYDEGAAIVRDIVPGVEGPLALIGTAEKGYASFEVTAEATGGHSSMPPDDLAIVHLAQAIDRVTAQPMPARLDGVTGAMFDYAVGEMDLANRLIFANRWLFEPLIRRRVTQQPATNATVRTTLAPTMIHGGVRPNVLPQKATAIVNSRIHPRNSIADVQAHLEATMGGPNITVQPFDESAWEPSAPADLTGGGFDAIRRAIGEVFPGTPVAPLLVIGATDSRHFADLTTDIYRFLPVTLEPDDLARIHGTDERIAVDAYGDLIRFYRRLIHHAGEVAAPDS